MHRMGQTAAHLRRLLGLLRCLVLYAANEPLALLSELSMRQAAHDHAQPAYSILPSAQHLCGVL
jgi:hypothetical protein